VDTPAVTSAQMKAMEAAANARGLSYDEMMRQAGEGCGKKVLEIFDAFDHEQNIDVLVLVGPGNNGGDGLVCAAALASRLGPSHVTLYVWKRETNPPTDEGWPLREALALDIRLYRAADDPYIETIAKLLGRANIAVDALLGTGQHGPFPAELEWLLAALRREQQRKPDLQVVAVDIPTGIDADSGEAISENHVRANLTCTFAYPKVGLLQGEGKKAAGRVEVVDIGFGEVGVRTANGL